MEQLNRGVATENIKIATDVPTCKTNLFKWLSDTVAEMMADCQANMKKAWDHTKLSRAWEHEVQVEAVSRASEIFDNFVPSSVVVPGQPTEGPHDSSDAPDEHAGWEGAPFMADDTAADDAWMEWIAGHVEDA